MLTVRILSPPTVRVGIFSPEKLSIGFVGVEVTSVPLYEGPCEATPTRETQIFPTGGKQMPENFTVNPIPRNYGLITYNGFEITVS